MAQCFTRLHWQASESFASESLGSSRSGFTCLTTRLTVAQAHRRAPARPRLHSPRPGRGQASPASSGPRPAPLVSPAPQPLPAPSCSLAALALRRRGCTRLAVWLHLPRPGFIRLEPGGLRLARPGAAIDGGPTSLASPPPGGRNTPSYATLSSESPHKDRTNTCLASPGRPQHSKVRNLARLCPPHTAGQIVALPDTCPRQPSLGSSRQRPGFARLALAADRGHAPPAGPQPCPGGFRLGEAAHVLRVAVTHAVNAVCL